jgi:hypothetical protein
MTLCPDGGLSEVLGEMNLSSHVQKGWEAPAGAAFVGYHEIGFE